MSEAINLRLCETRAAYYGNGCVSSKHLHVPRWGTNIFANPQGGAPGRLMGHGQIFIFLIDDGSN